jgi:putative transposase
MAFVRGRAWKPAPTRRRIIIGERRKEGKMHMRTRKTIIHDSAEYAINELYFITICANMKLCRFGKIKDQDIELSELGKTIEQIIINTNKKYSDNLIGDYVVMPNHVHMIMDMSQINDWQSDVKKRTSISDLVHNFKSFTTHEFNKEHPDDILTLWQRGYYDHRIRDAEEMIKIKEYIRDNPKRWAIDKFYLE